MSPITRTALRQYALGLAAVVVGAGLTSTFDSMWPLALGSSMAVIQTWAYLRTMRARAVARRDRRTTPRR